MTCTLSAKIMFGVTTSFIPTEFITWSRVTTTAIPTDFITWSRVTTCVAATDFITWGVG